MSRQQPLRRAWVILGILACLGSTTASGQVTTRPAPPLAKRVEARPSYPAKVDLVLRAIDETGKAPPGFVGGRPYENRAQRGEQPLPTVDREGDPIAYHTWDVNPRASERDRGTERLVVGSDGSAYYTPDDYKRFVVVRNPARSTLAGGVHVAPRPPQPDHETTRPTAPPRSNRNAPARPADKPVVTLDPRVAARVMPVVDYIQAHSEPPPETVGGRNYGNFGTEGGEVLPKLDAKGQPIRYREWDVNKKVPGRNRGAERIVTGSDGHVYYTSDHYATFQRIR